MTVYIKSFRVYKNMYAAIKSEDNALVKQNNFQIINITRMQTVFKNSSGNKALM